jgi:hypothetical protein
MRDLDSAVVSECALVLMFSICLIAQYPSAGSSRPDLHVFMVYLVDSYHRWYCVHFFLGLCYVWSDVRSR